MQLILLLEAAQDRNCILNGRLGDEHRLEATGESRILLHMLAILIKCRRADAVKLTASQRWLQKVRRIHRAVRLASTNERVHLVDEQDDPSVLRLHLREHGLQPLFELAAIFRTGDERTHIEREQLFILEALRHVALDNTQRQAFSDGRLANARLADQHRIILRAP